MPPEWNRNLQERLGGWRHLGHLTVYYDFAWPDIFGHDRATFRFGQSLATLARRECPEGKRPSLLLTNQNLPARTFENEGEYCLIVPILSYLASVADPAATFYAQHAGRPVTKLSDLQGVEIEHQELGAFLDDRLTLESLQGWVGREPERANILRELVEADIDPVPLNLANVLGQLNVADADVVGAIASYIGRIGNGEQAPTFFAQLLQSSAIRDAAADALLEKIPERIAEIKAKLVEYDELINRDGATETNVQEFIEKHPWIVGLQYVRTRGRVQIPRGELDFVLDRDDGFFDIVELKGPQDMIIAEPEVPEGERPASASAYAISTPLSKALAQAHHYRALLDSVREEGLRLQYGLSDTREPRILIVIGCSSSLSGTTQEILRQLNLSLHRVEVIPYDLLGGRTLGIINNLIKLPGYGPTFSENGGG